MMAEACERQGHTCALIALRDPHCQKIVEDLEEGKMPYLRLPAAGDAARDNRAAIEFRDRFAPDWMSLHLVAYGLHPRGLLFEATPRLREMIGTVPLHLMLHELWLGNDESPSWKHRVIGFLQRLSLRRLITALQPRVVATSNPVYAALLQTIGVDAQILPLFGNIPIADEAPLPGALTAAGISSENRSSWWVGLFFGGLYPEWKPEPFLSLLRRAAERTGKRICLVLAGNAGSDGDRIWIELGRDYSSFVTFVRLRHQSEAALSALMQASDFGIAASPWSIIGKSGSAAAMLDHGLPVIVTREDFQPRVKVALPPSTDPLLHRCDDALEDKLAAGLPRRAPCAQVDEVAALFLRQLAGTQSIHPSMGVAA
jgi:hypothetical protein